MIRLCLDDQKRNPLTLPIVCLIFAITVKLPSGIPQITPSVQTPSFSATPTLVNHLSSGLVQARPALSHPQALPTLRQRIHARPGRHAEPSSAPPRRARRAGHDRLDAPRELPPLALGDGAEPRGAVDGVAGGVDALGEEAVVVVAEEAAVEEDPGGDGGEAAGQAGAAGGVAEEAVGVGEVLVALSQAVHWRFRGVHNVCCELVRSVHSL